MCFPALTGQTLHLFKNLKMKSKLIVTVFAIFLISMSCGNNDQFPVTDLHIHLKGDFGIEDAVRKSEAEKINYGIVINCGLKFPVHKDSQIDSALLTLKDYPQFFIGMQAEGREWVDLFSKESVEKFDYVFTDAMTFTDEKGRRNRIWIKEETFIDDEEAFMDHLVATIVKILSEEPIDIYVNPTFLPAQMADRYDSFWTEKRMDKVIRAAKENNVAIEINNRYKIPSYEFLKRAKSEGVKFTVGTNNTDSAFSGAEYALDMIKRLKLTRDDFFEPVNKRKNG